MVPLKAYFKPFNNMNYVSTSTNLSILFGCFFLLFFTACSEEGSSKAENQDFTLQVVNQNLEDSIATFSWKDSTYEVLLTMGDTQSLVLPVAESNVGVIKAANSRIQIFVGPGESLSMTLSMEDDELDVKYAGSLAAAKNVSLRIQKEVLGQYPYNNPYAFYGMDLDSFQLYIDQAMNSMDSLLQDLSNNQPEWADLVKSHMGYRINDYAVNYPLYHPSIAKLDSFELDPAYWDNFADQFSVFEEELLQLESKQSLTYNYVRNLNRFYKDYSDSIVEDDSTRIAEMFFWADSIYESEALQRTFKVSLLEEQVTYGGVGNISDWLSEQVTTFAQDKKNERAGGERYESKLAGYEKWWC